MDKKTAILAAFWIAAFLVLFLVPATPAAVKASTLNDGYPFDNTVDVIHCRPSEGWCNKQTTHNTVTGEGLNYTRDFLSGLSRDPATSNWTQLELSTSTAAAQTADASCPSAVTGNGLDIAQATLVYRSAIYNYTMNRTFTATGTQNSIAKVCLSNNTGSASTDLMASALLSSTVNMVSSDTLTISYTIAARNQTG